MPVEGKEAGFPSQFGRYTLVQRLATGGMAEVFKAKILSTHGFEKLLVIKRILPNLAADKTFVSMFIDEAKLTAQLIHPKIVQVTDFGEENGQYFIALEFVDGFDGLALLRSAAQKHVRLPIPICMFVASEVLDALDYAHNAKDGDGKPMHLVHRDISPSNVFIARRGDVKLGDFGIAHAQERESKTQAGTLKGKYGYMSPEQVTGGDLDGRSDIFAVGIVLAEMLMGKRLFSAPNDLDVLLMVRDGRLERWDKHSKDIPPRLDTIVRKALAKNLDERFQSAADFRNALEDLQFKFGMRVGPADVGLLASDLFDTSPDAVERLKEHGKKWEIRPEAPAPGGGRATASAQTPADAGRRARSASAQPGWDRRSREHGGGRRARRRSWPARCRWWASTSMSPRRPSPTRAGRAGLARYQVGPSRAPLMGLGRLFADQRRKPADRVLSPRMAANRHQDWPTSTRRRMRSRRPARPRTNRSGRFRRRCRARSRTTAASFPSSRPCAPSPTWPSQPIRG